MGKVLRIGSGVPFVWTVHNRSMFQQGESLVTKEPHNIRSLKISPSGQNLDLNKDDSAEM